MSESLPALSRSRPLIIVVIVNPRPIKLGLTFISSTIKSGKMDLLIPKRTHEVQKEMMSALR